MRQRHVTTPASDDAGVARMNLSAHRGGVRRSSMAERLLPQSAMSSRRSRRLAGCSRWIGLLSTPMRNEPGDAAATDAVAVVVTTEHGAATSQSPRGTQRGCSRSSGRRDWKGEQFPSHHPPPPPPHHRHHRRRRRGLRRSGPPPLDRDLRQAGHAHKNRGRKSHAVLP